jgi:hypothetical protein
LTRLAAKVLSWFRLLLGNPNRSYAKPARTHRIDPGQYIVLGCRLILGATSEGKGGGRNNVKCFANARTSMGYGLDERLRHVIGVNVMSVSMPIFGRVISSSVIDLPPAGNSGVTVRRSPESGALRGPSAK